MTDLPNTQPDSRNATVMDAPDKKVSVRDLFGIDSDMMVPAFSEADERVPDLDPSYVFDGDTTLFRSSYHPWGRPVLNCNPKVKRKD